MRGHRVNTKRRWLFRYAAKLRLKAMARQDMIQRPWEYR